MQLIGEQTIREIRDLAICADGPRRTEGGVDYAVAPNGTKLHIIEPPGDPDARPTRRRGHFTAWTPEGFTSFVLFQQVAPDGQIFVDRDGEFRAVLNFHGHTDSYANHCDYTVSFRPPESESYRKWTSAEGEKMDQVTFAEFIEERRSDIGDPDAATLSEMVLDLEGSTGASFASRKSLSAGNVSISYQEDNELKTSSSLELPKTLLLSLPIFFHNVQVIAQMRYRVAREEVAISFSLRGLTEARREAFVKLKEEISKATGHDIIEGRYYRDEPAATSNEEPFLF